jgi:hypothetical protein
VPWGECFADDCQAQGRRFETDHPLHSDLPTKSMIPQQPGSRQSGASLGNHTEFVVGITELSQSFETVRYAILQDFIGGEGLIIVRK